MRWLGVVVDRSENELSPSRSMGERGEFGVGYRVSVPWWVLYVCIVSFVAGQGNDGFWDAVFQLDLELPT